MNQTAFVSTFFAPPTIPSYVLFVHVSILVHWVIFSFSHLVSREENKKSVAVPNLASYRCVLSEDLLVAASGGLVWVLPRRFKPLLGGTNANFITIYLLNLTDSTET